jgi:ribosomal peptide maturation radical SAM protein 1
VSLQIKLVNMPFATANRPSIALTQLKAVAEALHGDKIHVEICYLNHEFCRILGSDLYDAIANTMLGMTTGLGEWLFRAVAFPDQPDNSAQYLRRFQHHLGTQPSALRERLDAFRAALPRTLDALIERYQLHEARVVGLTSMFFQNLASIALAQRLKQIDPKQIVVMGGANCEGTMGIELAANVPVLDFVFSGNSLISFPQFVGHVLAGDTDACHRIDGVFSRMNCRSIHDIAGDAADVDWGKHKPTMQLKGVGAMGRELDINANVPLDYDGFLHSARTILPNAAEKLKLLFETSRGCWWGERAHCTFCGLNGSTMAYRAMTAERAKAMLRGLIDRYAGQFDIFESVDNILPREYIAGVFADLRPPEGVSFFYEIKSDLSESDVRTLAGGGVRLVQPGIEALATSTLKLMRKGTTAFHGLRLLGYCKKYGVAPVWNLLVGFPGETQEVYQTYSKLLPEIFHLPPAAGVFPVRFDRYSPYFTLEKQYGLELSPYDFYKLCYPFPKAALRNLAYYFQDVKYESQYLRDVAQWLPKLGALVERWKSLWKSAACTPRLEWVQTSDGITVEDTRTGRLCTHVLSGSAAEALRSLGQPERPEHLSSECQGALEELTNRSLVVAERGKLFSLVAGVPAAAAPPAPAAQLAVA